jgi:hypothetical protein
MTKQEIAKEEQKAFKWMQDKGYDRRACKEIAPTLAKYLNEQLILSGVVVPKGTLFCISCKSANVKTHIEEYFECLDCGREFTK